MRHLTSCFVLPADHRRQAGRQLLHAAACGLPWDRWVLGGTPRCAKRKGSGSGATPFSHFRVSGRSARCSLGALLHWHSVRLRRGWALAPVGDRRAGCHPGPTSRPTVVVKGSPPQHPMARFGCNPSQAESGFSRCNALRQRHRVASVKHSGPNRSRNLIEASPQVQ